MTEYENLLREMREKNEHVFQQIDLVMDDIRKIQEVIDQIEEVNKSLPSRIIELRTWYKTTYDCLWMKQDDMEQMII